MTPTPSLRSSSVLFRLLFVFLLLAGCAAPATTPAPSDVATPAEDASTGGSTTNAEPIRIGVLLPLTGPLSALGNEMNNGYEIARQWINANGGINGRPIEYVRTDAPRPEDAVGVAERLIVEEKVPLIMGSYSSGIAMPASEVANRYQIPYWETGAATGDLTERGFKYLFRTAGSSARPENSAIQFEFLSEVVAPALGKTPETLRLAFLYENSAFGSSAYDAFINNLPPYNMSLVAEQDYVATTSDLSSAIQNMESAETDVVITASYVNDSILFLRQSQELGFSPSLIVGGGAGFTTPDIATAVGSAVNGIVATASVPLNITDGVLCEGLKPAYSEWRKMYEDAYGRPPLEHATLGFQGAMVLFQHVLPNAAGLTPDEIATAARAVDIADGCTVGGFGVKFDETGQNTRAVPTVHQYQNNQLVPIYPNKYGYDLILPMSDAPGR